MRGDGTLVVDIPDMDPDDMAGDVARLGIPANVGADLERG